MTRAQIIKQGPCAFCGGPYAAHRMIETQMGRVAAGDNIADVAREFDMAIHEMVASWKALLELALDRVAKLTALERRNTP